MSGGEMNIVISICLAFLLMAFVFVPLGIAGAAAFIWFGDKVEALLAATQRWQERKGWW